MVYTIIAKNPEGQHRVFRVKSDEHPHKLKNLIKDAVNDFIKNGGDEAEKALSVTSNGFNWGDLALWLPEKFARAHKFQITETYVANITVDHDENLLPGSFTVKGE